MWNERYSSTDYVYGTEPNDFLRASVQQLPAGPVLSIGEGEGRNACFLAGLGYAVTAVDASHVGLAKARALAAQRGVEIATIEADLAHYSIAPETWAGVVSIFCHLPPALRQRVHRSVVGGLRPGGVLLLEAYAPRQLEFASGGPRVPELLYDLRTLEDDLAGLEMLQAEERVREINEGTFHFGLGAVVQVIARKPRQAS